jgi:putative sigma-54 modulation protein
LDKYGLKVGDVQVVLAVEKYRHSAELVLNVNGAVIQGKTSTTEMYSSIDQLIDKISRQLVKRKDKLNNHKVRKAARSTRSSVPPLEPPPRFVTVQTPLQSLTAEQAVDRLATQSAPFLVFKETLTDRIKIMRRLENGSIELIDPQPV